MCWLVLCQVLVGVVGIVMQTIVGTHCCLLMIVVLCQSWQLLLHVILRRVLLMDLLPVVVVVAPVDASVTDPDDTSCCRSVCLVIGVEGSCVTVVDRHSALFGHVSWLSTSVANICCVFFFCPFSSLLVVVVSFAFSFVVVSFSFAISFLSFEWISLSNRLLIVLAFSSFVVVVAVVVPVVAVAFAFVVLSFALVLALLSFSFVVPCRSYVHWCRPLVVAA